MKQQTAIQELVTELETMKKLGQLLTPDVLTGLDIAAQFDNAAENNGWIKLEGVAGEMLDCDCWVLDSLGNIFFSEQEQYIPIGLYKYYMPISKPNVLPDGF